MWKSFIGRTRCDTRLFNWRPCLPYITFYQSKNMKGKEKTKEKKTFSNKLSSAKMTMRMHLTGWKLGLDVSIVPWILIILSFFILHNYYEIKNARVLQQNLLSSLNCENRTQPPKSNLTYKESVNENTAKSIYNLFALCFD